MKTIVENLKANVENLNEKLYEDFKAHVAGEWLEGIRKMQIETDLTHDIIEDEKEMMDGLKGINYEGTRGAASDERIINAMESLNHSIADYAARLSELIDSKQQAVKAINQLDDELQRVILVRRYIRNESYGTIESTLHYSHEWVMKQRRAGLVKLFECMPSDVRVNIPKAI